MAATTYESNREDLIGKTVRNENLRIIGVIVEIADEVFYYENIQVAVLDNGERIPTRYLMGTEK